MIFNSRERQGVLILLFLIICTLIIPRQFRSGRHPFFLLTDTPEDSLLTLPLNLKKPRPGLEIVELNTADSITLVKIRGIGPYYATKILKYRERLGGYVSVMQLKELNMTYFNIDSCKAMFTVNPSLILKRHLDTMSFKAILRHPYLQYEDVQLILNAKQKYGKLSYGILEEKKILPAHKLKKIKPYFH